MIDKKLDPDIAENAAISISSERLRYNFNDEEITELKADYFEINKVLAIRDSSKKRFVTAFDKDFDTSAILDIMAEEGKRKFGDEGIKTLKSSAAQLLDKINRGYEIKLHDLYVVPYYDELKVGLYLQDGTLSHTRAMTAEERQLEIPGQAKVKNIVNE